MVLRCGFAGASLRYSAYGARKRYLFQNVFLAQEMTGGLHFPVRLQHFPDIVCPAISHAGTKVINRDAWIM